MLHACVARELHKPTASPVPRPHYHAVVSFGVSSNRQAFRGAAKHLRNQGIYANFKPCLFSTGVAYVVLPSSKKAAHHLDQEPIFFGLQKEDARTLAEGAPGASHKPEMVGIELGDFPNLI